MSYHILHITTPNVSISSDRGLLFCKYENNETRMIAVQDVKAVIVAARGIIFTNDCLAKLLENNVVILHCNMRYQPVGLSLPLERIVRPEVFYKQTACNFDFTNKLWKMILKTKVINQANNLALLGEENNNLLNLINRPLMNEANIAKQYWERYFSILGNPQKREHKNAKSFENACLNYGYAIIKTLIYRSVIIHGLTAGLGIHHSGKYKASPLVYDLMEPYRPFIDYYLYCFLKEYPESLANKDIKAFSRYVAECIKQYRLEINEKSYKLLDTIDIYIERIADAFIDYNCTNLFLPDIRNQYRHTDKQRNREYEE